MHFITYVLLRNCHINTKDSCDEAFIKFTRCYVKQYKNETAARANFCINFQQRCVNGVPGSCVMKPGDDQPTNILTTTRRLRDTVIDQFDQDSCQKMFCYSFDPLTVLPKIYQSIDLREAGLMTPAKDQGQCGGSWAFVVNALLENAILVDHQFYENATLSLQSESSFWALPSSRLNLSEQWLLVNVLSNESAQNGCLYGDVETALSYLWTNFYTQEERCTVYLSRGPPLMTPCVAQDPTVELATNYPDNWTQMQSPPSQPLKAKLQKELFLLPFQILDNIMAVGQGRTLERSPVVGIFYKVKDNGPFDARTIQTIQSYLSRGIAIAGIMKVPDINCTSESLATDDCTNKSTSFYNYDGTTVLKQPCPKYLPTHYVTFIGYGKKNGVNVWVVKNSWGPNWGANGSFYVPIGGNDFCIEQYAFAIIPKYYNTSYSNYTQIQIGDHSLRGRKQLDKDEGIVVKNDFALPTAWWLDSYILTALVVAGVLVWALLVYCVLECVSGCEGRVRRPAYVVDKGE